MTESPALLRLVSLLAVQAVEVYLAPEPAPQAAQEPERAL